MMGRPGPRRRRGGQSPRDLRDRPPGPAGWVAFVVAVGLVLAACSNPPPAEQLVTATETTFGGDVAFSLRARIDQASLEELGDRAGTLRQLLDSTEITGRRTAETLAVNVTALGVDAFRLRAFGAEELYLMVAFDVLGALTEVPDPAVFGPRLLDAGVDQEVVVALTTLFGGDWVGVTGDIGTGLLDQLPGRRASPRASGAAEGATRSAAASPGGPVRELIGGDVAGFVDRYVAVTDVEGTEAGRRFDVRVDVPALFADLSAGALPGGARPTPPPPLEGTILLADGQVTRMTLELAALGDAPTGSLLGGIDLVLEITEQGEVEPATRPPDAATVSADQLVDATRTLVRTAAEGG